MPEEKNNYELSPEEIEDERKVILATEIAKKAVISLNIPEFTNDGQFVNPRWNVFYIQDWRGDIILIIQFNPPITLGIIHTSLMYIAGSILDEMELILSSPNAMSLFNVEESEIETVVYEKTLLLMRDYIFRLPEIIYHSFHQTVNEILVSHIKKFIEYDLRDHWETLGLPKDYSLVPENSLSNITKLFPESKLGLIPYLETIEEEFSAYRKGAFSNRKVWLTPKVFTQLPDDYEQLLTQYKKATKEYKSQRKAFFKVNRRASFDDWDKHWEEFSNENFPNLSLSGEIKNYIPSQLAYRHLAESLGFSADYMEKIVGIARKQAKNKSSQQKTDI